MTTPDRHREGVACGDPLAAHLSWLKHTWIAASKHRLLLAMTTPDRHREGVACGDPHAAHLSWPKHTWIAASKHRFLLAMTNRTVIAKVRSTCGDPLARN